MRSKLHSYMMGGLIVLVTALMSLWLGLTGKLGLYVHPRYITFTIVLAGIAVVAAVVGAKYGVSDEPEATDVKRSKFAVLTAAICLFGALTLLVIKPATLTSTTANQRGINSASLDNTSSTVQLRASPLFVSDNYSNLKVKDWAGLLAQTKETSFFTGKRANLTGFVAADQHDPKNIFYVSRFRVTCCVVDAQPVGVAVYEPGWKSKYPIDSWVEVSGQFVENPSSLSLEPVVIKPQDIKPVKQPSNPYEQ